jgi:hypothetical protein
MKFCLVLALFASLSAHAKIVSPSSVETGFTFESEFVTADKGETRELVLSQAKHLFGYLQNEELPRTFGLNARIAGIGAPRWEPAVEILEDRPMSGKRFLRYRMNGKLLLLKEVATQLVPRQEWSVFLPYELDSVYDEACTDKEHSDPSEFWYFQDPFRKGCEKLRREPLAREVTIKLFPLPAVPDSLPLGLDALRGDNGNGDLFEITAINGFDQSSKSPRDDGRVNFQEMNKWFVDQGFEETVLQKFKNRPIHRFDKIVRRPGGGELHLRITRLLAETDLDGGKHVTFAKFLREAIRSSDVVIYEGHSGLGANLELSAIEKRAGGRIDFDRAKRQLFFFDSCSSYSYYLGMFDGRKDPGTLSVMSNGLASLFGYEIPMTKHFYRNLLKADNGGLTWLELLENMEKPLRGNTFMLNVDVN